MELVIMIINDYHFYHIGCVMPLVSRIIYWSILFPRYIYFNKCYSFIRHNERDYLENYLNLGKVTVAGGAFTFFLFSIK